MMIYPWYQVILGETIPLTLLDIVIRYEYY